MPDFARNLFFLIKKNILPFILPTFEGNWTSSLSRILCSTNTTNEEERRINEQEASNVGQNFKNYPKNYPGSGVQKFQNFMATRGKPHD